MTKQTALNKTVKFFQFVQILSFRAYREGPMPILHLSLEVILTLWGLSYKCYEIHVNLQYNTLGGWFDGTIVSLTKRLMFQALFFHNFLQIFLQKSFQFIFFFIY